jgi:hypothetical protein
VRFHVAPLHGSAVTNRDSAISYTLQPEGKYHPSDLHEDASMKRKITNAERRQHQQVTDASSSGI